MNTFIYDVADDSFASAGKVSEAIQKKLSESEFNIDIDLLRRISLALYECEVNLVIHANGGRITVTCGESCVEIEATDNGPGISDVEQAMILGFSTASSEMKKRGFGEGKGFSVMKKYSDYLDVCSERGRGTVVRMRFNK